MRHGTTEMNEYLSKPAPSNRYGHPRFVDPRLYDTRLTARGKAGAQAAAARVRRLHPRPQVRASSRRPERALCTDAFHARPCRRWLAPARSCWLCRRSAARWRRRRWRLAARASPCWWSRCGANGCTSHRMWAAHQPFWRQSSRSECCAGGSAACMQAHVGCLHPHASAPCSLCSACLHLGHACSYELGHIPEVWWHSEAPHDPLAIHPEPERTSMQHSQHQRAQHACPSNRQTTTTYMHQLTRHRACCCLPACHAQTYSTHACRRCATGCAAGRSRS